MKKIIGFILVVLGVLSLINQLLVLGLVSEPVQAEIRFGSFLIAGLFILIGIYYLRRS